jgi:hypothetical protein
MYHAASPQDDFPPRRRRRRNRRRSHGCQHQHPAAINFHVDHPPAEQTYHFSMSRPELKASLVIGVIARDPREAAAQAYLLADQFVAEMKQVRDRQVRDRAPQVPVRR